MNILQVREFFQSKNKVPCPLTERLIRAGYQQTSGGYIDRAKELGLAIDYTRGEPNQYWHLMEEYLPTLDDSDSFGKNVVCGELIFWMAEVSEAVPKDILLELLERITESADLQFGRPKYDRIKWNREIQNVCFDAIVRVVESGKKEK